MKRGEHHAMSGKGNVSHPGDITVHDVPPVRDLAFSMLSLLIETAATQLRVDVPVAAEIVRSSSDTPVNMSEARAAIDAANALLGSVRAIMEMDALRAIEGMLTQLQIEYVRQVSTKP
jgi:hypothetical protein